MIFSDCLSFALFKIFVCITSFKHFLDVTVVNPIASCMHPDKRQDPHPWHIGVML